MMVSDPHFFCFFSGLRPDPAQIRRFCRTLIPRNLIMTHRQAWFSAIKNPEKSWWFIKPSLWNFHFFPELWGMMRKVLPS